MNVEPRPAANNLKKDMGVIILDRKNSSTKAFTDSTLLNVNYLLKLNE